LRSGSWGVSVVFDIASATPGPVLNMAIPPTVFGSLKSEAAATDLDDDGDLDVVMTVYGSPPAPSGTPPPPNVVRVL
jgi:hypothetical protein